MVGALDASGPFLLSAQFGSVRIDRFQERLISLVKADLVEYELSRTPTMDPTTLSSDQVADVIGYLLSLRGIR